VVIVLPSNHYYGHRGNLVTKFSWYNIETDCPAQETGCPILKTPC